MKYQLNIELASHLGKYKAWKKTSSIVDFLKRYWVIQSVPLMNLERVRNRAKIMVKTISAGIHYYPWNT
jgi:hypothetical protein